MRQFKSILLVEDNPDDVALTLRAFKRENIVNDIVVARDGVEALNYLFCENDYADRNPLEQPSVVLLDLKLPKIDGIGVLRRIRAHEQTQHLPVVVLTTSDEDRDKLDSYRLGANSYVRKPVDFHQFHKAIRQLGMYWLVLNEPPPSSPI